MVPNIPAILHVLGFEAEVRANSRYGGAAGIRFALEAAQDHANVAAIHNGSGAPLALEDDGLLG